MFQHLILVFLHKYGESPFSIRKCRDQSSWDSQLSFWNGEARYHLTSSIQLRQLRGRTLQIQTKNGVLDVVVFSCLLGAIHACCLLFLGCFCCCCCCMFFRCYFERKPKFGKFGCNQKIEAVTRKLLFFWGARKRKKRLHKYSHELCFWIAFWKGVSRCLNRKVGVSNKRFLGSANVRPFVQLQPFRNTRKSEKRRKKTRLVKSRKKAPKLLSSFPCLKLRMAFSTFSTIKNLNPPFFLRISQTKCCWPKTIITYRIPYTYKTLVSSYPLKVGGTWQSSYRKLHDYQKRWLAWLAGKKWSRPAAYLLELTLAHSSQIKVRLD